MKKYLEEYFVSEEDEKKQSIYAVFVGSDVVYNTYRDEELEKTLNDIDLTYDMLKYVETWCSSSETQQKKQSIIKYINTIDNIDIAK